MKSSQSSRKKINHSSDNQLKAKTQTPLSVKECGEVFPLSVSSPRIQDLVVIPIKLTQSALSDLVDSKDKKIMIQFASSTPSGDFMIGENCYQFTAIDEPPSAICELLTVLRSKSEDATFYSRGRVVRRLTLRTTPPVPASSKVIKSAPEQISPPEKRKISETKTSQNSSPNESLSKKFKSDTDFVQQQQQQQIPTITSTSTDPKKSSYENSAPKTILEKTLKLLSLGPKTTDYLAKRLAVDPQTIHSTLSAHATFDAQQGTWTVSPPLYPDSSQQFKELEEQLSQPFQPVTQIPHHPSPLSEKKPFLSTSFNSMNHSNASISENLQNINTGVNIHKSLAPPKSSLKELVYTNETNLVENNNNSKQISEILEKIKSISSTKLQEIEGLEFQETTKLCDKIENETEYRKKKEEFEKVYKIYKELDKCLATSTNHFLELDNYYKNPLTPEIKEASKVAIQKLYTERCTTVQRLLQTYKIFHEELKSIKNEIKIFVDKFSKSSQISNNSNNNNNGNNNNNTQIPNSSSSSFHT